MRLLLVTSSYPRYVGDGRAAAGLFVADLARVFQDLGHEVAVATPRQEGAAAGDGRPRVQWLRWRGADRPLSQLRPGNPRDWVSVASLALELPCRLWSAARQIQPQGILALWAIPCGWWSLGVARRLRVPLINWCLGSDVWWAERNALLRSLLIRTLRASRCNFADGIELAARATRMTACSCEFLPSSRLAVAVTPSSPRTPRTVPTFLFVGRYVEVKGIDVLLAAFARYVALGGRGRLVLRGGGPLAETMRTMATSLGGRVEVGGYVDREELARLLGDSDVVVIPSRVESIPLVYSDALQSGRPIVCTDVGDMGRLMRQQEVGLLVPPADVEALAQALLTMDHQGIDRFRTAIAAAAREFDLRSNGARILARFAEAS